MYEQQLIRKITACTGAIRRGDKAPNQTDAPKMLNALKAINVPMFEDLLEKYKEAVATYEDIQSKKS